MQKAAASLQTTAENHRNTSSPVVIFISPHVYLCWGASVANDQTPERAAENDDEALPVAELSYEVESRVERR